MRATTSRSLRELLRGDVALPTVVQAPMAGVSTPQLAAAVSNAGALGSIALGGCGSAAQARELLRATRALTPRPFNANVFCHRAPLACPPAEASAWLARLAPMFDAIGAPPPLPTTELTSGYLTFQGNDELLRVLVEEQPRVVSFHFGLPPAEWVKQLQAAGIVTFACVTSLRECALAVNAGVDAVVAQGNEAGGHRGVFDDSEDLSLGTFALVRLLAQSCSCPVPIIAAGGVMDGAGIAAALQLGASAVQMGTAFILCPESSASDAYRAALSDPRRAANSRVIAAVSGRPARGMVNRLLSHLNDSTGGAKMPEYPLPYAATKLLLAEVAKKKAVLGDEALEFGVHWAGQGAPMARAMPAADLVQTLARELSEAQAAGISNRL